MASKSETGHAKIVANFNLLIEFISALGPAYNPSKDTLKLEFLIDLKNKAEGALSNVIAKNTEYNTKVNERYNSFLPVKPLSTRLMNAFQITNASKETINDAKAFHRKIQGKRATAITVPVDAEAPAPSKNSISQQSYSLIVQHFSGLVAVLKSEETYAPNEEDMKIEFLNDFINNLNKANMEVNTTYFGISNSRLDRNEVLYNSTTSVHTTGSDIKKYIKSIFGANSPQYNQISGISFTKK